MAINTKTIPITPGRIALSFGTADTTASFTFDDFPGVLLNILYEQYDTTNNATGTVAITDENSKTLFSKATLTDGATTLIHVRLGESKDVAFFPSKKYTCTVTLSGAPGNAGTCYVTLGIV